MGNRTKIYGVGINDADYVTSPKINGKQVPCPYYSTWKSMFVRSYSKKYQYKQTTYEGCYVDGIWHKFSNFYDWMIKQEWRGMALDKDLININNKKYGPYTCCFVPDFVNNCFRVQNIKENDLPLGVCSPKKMVKSPRPYASCIFIYGKGSKHLGHFDSIHEAHLAWQLAKISIIKNTARRYSEIKGYLPYILLAIERRADLIIDDVKHNRITVRP